MAGSSLPSRLLSPLKKEKWTETRLRVSVHKLDAYEGE
jgi:hypothetical protein